MPSKSSDNKKKDADAQQKQPIMVRIMLWVLFAYPLVMAILYFPSLSSLLMLIAALLALPLKKLQKLYLKVFFRRWIQVILALLIVLAATVYAPAPPATEPNEYFGEVVTEDGGLPETEPPVTRLPEAFR